MQSASRTRWTAAVLFAGAWVLAARPVASSGLPAAWEIKMTITVRGDYALEGRARSAGRYRMTFVWTGGLEIDGDDYILVHDRSELADWRAEETLAGPEEIQLLTTDGFSEKPELNVVYVLRRDDGLSLDFFIRGFSVPRLAPEAAFYLNLPSSGECGDRESSLNYNTYVKTGSNAVVLDDPATHPGARTKTFRWTWSHRESLPLQNQTLYGLNRHEADISIVVTPKD